MPPQNHLQCVSEVEQAFPSRPGTMKDPAIDAGTGKQSRTANITMAIVRVINGLSTGTQNLNTSKGGHEAGKSLALASESAEPSIIASTE